MDTYQYKYGDRPLEGYTIQRAAGRGGFGEVYYAISDSGRQVALKAVQSYEQIEVRGISQCMNLKSPHLVTIFDVKYNDKGKPFVIMEYISGPSLADLLKESPGGLGTQKAAFFLREIGKGLSFLHDCGIVHRDLKPGNIFYENGYVKIGDYGLTKAIDTSQHISQNTIVGTVQYMAPEIGTGNYDHRVDIYALGVVLYEMLIGQLPFPGFNPAQVLMKHMAASPSLENFEEPFAHVIRKALAKDPAERYRSVQVMVEDVFGTEHVRNSVSQFAPEELSVVAEHIAKKMRDAQPTASTAQGDIDKPADRQAATEPTSTEKAPFRSKSEHTSDVRRQGTREENRVPRARVPEWRSWIGKKGPYDTENWTGHFAMEGLLGGVFASMFGAAIGGDVGAVVGFLLPGTIVLLSWCNSLICWRNKYRLHCAQLCVDAGDYVQGASFALAMGRFGVDQAAGGAIVVSLADVAAESGHSDVASRLYETASKRWRDAHAECTLRRTHNMKADVG